MNSAHSRVVKSPANAQGFNDSVSGSTAVAEKEQHTKRVKPSTSGKQAPIYINPASTKEVSHAVDVNNATT